MDPMYLKWCLKVLMFWIFVWRATNGLEGCQQPMEIGKLQVFRHTQKLGYVTTLIWSVTRQNGTIESINCVVSTQSCSNPYSNIIGNISQQNDQTTTFLTILNTTYDMRSVKISHDNSTVIDTCSLELFARPSNAICSTPALRSDKTGIDVKCSAIKIYPDNAIPILYIQNNGYINITIPLTKSVYFPGYYYFEYTYAVPASSLIRGNNTLFMSIYQSFTNGQTFAVNSNTVWILLNQSNSSIQVNPLKTTGEYDATLNASLTITCSADLIPAPRISLTRRSSGLELNSTENSKLLTFTLTSFNCLDTDEYVCLVDNGLPDVPNATSSIGIYGSSCGVQLQATQANLEKIQVKAGSGVYVSILVIFRTLPSSYALRRSVGGVSYLVPTSFYTIEYTSSSRYYGKLILALFQMNVDELADYTFSTNEGALYNFTLAKYQSYSSIQVNSLKTTGEYDATLKASLTITCSADPFPAPRISLTRKSSGVELYSTENSKLLTFTLTSFNCLDTDEYVCLVDNGLPDVPNATSSIGIYGSSCGVQLQATQPNLEKIQVKAGSVVYVSILVIYRTLPSSYALRRSVGGVSYLVPTSFYSIEYTSSSRYYSKLILALFQMNVDELADYTFSTNGAALYNFTLADEFSINYQNVAIGVGVAAIGVICVTIVVALVCYYRNVKSSRLRSDDNRRNVYDATETSTSYKQDYLEPTVNRSNTNSDSADDLGYTDNTDFHNFGDQASILRKSVLTPGDNSPVNDTNQPVYSVYSNMSCDFVSY